MAKDTKINDLITSALRRHPRRNTEVVSVIKSHFASWLKDLCKEYPFWFTKVEPGHKFLSTLPLTQEELQSATPVTLPGGVDYWMDRGILRVEDGVDTYNLFAPVESPIGDQDGDFWQAVKAQKPLYAQLWDIRGEMKYELGLPTQRQFLQNRVKTSGAPCVVIFESGRDGDYVRFSPTPDKSYIIALSWVNTEPYNYYLDEADVATTNYTNKFLQEYEEVCSYVCQLKAAEYFHDITAIKYYNMVLYGEDPNDAFGGKVGNIKKEHTRKNSAQSFTVGVYKGNPNYAGGGVRNDRRRRGGSWGNGFYGI